MLCLCRSRDQQQVSPASSTLPDSKRRPAPGVWTCTPRSYESVYHIPSCTCIVVVFQLWAMKSEDSTQQWHTPYSCPVTYCLVKFSTKFMFSHYQALQNSIHFAFWWAYFRRGLLLVGILHFKIGWTLQIKQLKTQWWQPKSANPNSPWAHVREGLHALLEGYSHLRNGGLIFGRAYFRRGLLLECYVMLSWEVSAFKISWLQSYPNLTSLASLSCFSQNSNAYNFSSNETEYDPETTHNDKIFPVINSSASCRRF